MTLAETVALLYTGNILPMVAYVSLTLLAFFILSQNPKGQLNRIFAVMALTASAWNVAMFFVLSSQTAEQALSNWKLYQAAVLLLVPSWTYFALTFTGRRITPVLVYTPSAIFVPFLFFTDTVFSGAVLETGYYLATSGGGVRTALQMYIVIYILYGLMVMVNSYRKTGRAERTRIKWLVYGMGVVVIAGVLDNFLTIAGVPALPISPATSVIAVAGIAYSFIGGVNNR